MIESIYTGIRNLLKGDDEIQTLLGGQYVFIAHVAQTNQIPSITILDDGTASKKRTSYNEFKVRDETPSIRIDVWSRKSRLETVKLADRIDELLIADGVAGTWGWEKISSGRDMFERDTGIYHKSLVYRFSYKITDS